MEPEKAAKMFVEWWKWRKSFVPLGFIPDSEVSNELGIDAVYLQGLSKKGFPVLIAQSRKHRPIKDQVLFKSKFPFLPSPFFSISLYINHMLINCSFNLEYIWTVILFSKIIKNNCLINSCLDKILLKLLTKLYIYILIL